MKAIVLYYSRSGKTERLANLIANNLDCDKIKIEMKKPYGNYFSAIIRNGLERKKNEIAEVKTEIPDLTDYDTIIFGFPIWYGDVPNFALDFIQKCACQGKTIIPFATFSGNDIRNATSTLERKIEGAEIKFPFNYGTLKKDDFSKWIENIKTCF